MHCNTLNVFSLKFAILTISNVHKKNCCFFIFIFIFFLHVIHNLYRIDTISIFNESYIIWHGKLDERSHPPMALNIIIFFSCSDSPAARPPSPVPVRLPFCRTANWSPCGTPCETSRDSRPARRT